MSLSYSLTCIILFMKYKVGDEFWTKSTALPRFRRITGFVGGQYTFQWEEGGASGPWTEAEIDYFLRSGHWTIKFNKAEAIRRFKRDFTLSE